MTAGYTYNGKGQRVKKVVNGTPTIFHYNRQGLLAETDQSGHTTAEYVYLNSVPLAKIEGTSVYYYANDHLRHTPEVDRCDRRGCMECGVQAIWGSDHRPVIDGANNLRFPGQYDERRD